MHTIYRTRRVITLNGSPADENAKAQYIAVHNGRITAIGDRDAIKPFGSVIDERYAESVILPGFVEGHAHAMTGGMWRYLYVGAHDRVMPDGSIAPGLTRFDQVLDALRRADQAMREPDAALIAWGFDPLLVMERRVSVADLDAIVPHRPLCIIHSNFHLVNVNSSTLSKVGYTRDTPLDGLMKNASGALSGEIAEMAAKYPIYRALGFAFADSDGSGLMAYGAAARHVGVTTATDLFADLTTGSVRALQATTARADFPLRLVPALNVMSRTPKDAATAARDFEAMSHDKLRLGAVKLMTDGSIQGFSARLKAPGYLGGQPNGIWNIAPQQLTDYLREALAVGAQAHIHSNGDEAIELAIDATRQALASVDASDHRTTLQHCQMADAAQFAAMSQLGMCANLFSNHLWFFGDVHVEHTLGLERASRMNATRSALAAGVPIALHSDSPVTPLNPLLTAWCAVARTTAKGRVLGEAERLTVFEALRAVTLGAAYTLKLDHEVGSLAIGKRADFAALDGDPLTAPLREVKVVGTVLDGAPTQT